ncbi:MAG: signal peptidase I [Hyphomicrobium sp.]
MARSSEVQEMSLETKDKLAGQSGWWDSVKIVLQAFAIAMVVRYLLFQPFNIPSGSMKQTLLVGDYLFVSKLSYGYSKYSFPFSLDLFEGRIFATEPTRGDVAVFRLPRDNSVDYIKRVIGLPGDEIQVKGGVLYINGSAIPKVRKGDFVTSEDGDGIAQKLPVFEETLPNGVTYTVLDAEPNGTFDNTGVFKVPAGHYFMMGDNRDNSTDSRATWLVGYVPFENFIGRADIIFYSCASDEPGRCSLVTPWTWPFDIRWSRIFNLVR